MNRNLVRVGLALGIAGAVALTTVVAAQGQSGRDGKSTVSTRLTGLQEDPGVVSTSGTGSFRATVDRGDKTIDYRLSYSDTEGTVTQAHLHLGSRHQSGGISVFLCSNLGNGPVGTQACPPSGTISGTIVPADVLGPAGQGLPAGNFGELVAAIKAGVVYVNVHSTMTPSGEIRGQLR